ARVRGRQRISDRSTVARFGSRPFPARRPRADHSRRHPVPRRSGRRSCDELPVPQPLRCAGAAGLPGLHLTKREDRMNNDGRRTVRIIIRSGAIAAAVLCLSAGTAAADIVTSWNHNVVAFTIAAGRSNPETGAATADMHIAMYDAISSIDGGYTPFATRVANVPADASREAAALEAAYQIVAALYPAASFPALADQFFAAYTSDMSAIPDGPAKADGKAVGQAAAAGLLAKRQ